MRSFNIYSSLIKRHISFCPKQIFYSNQTFLKNSCYLSTNYKDNDEIIIVDKDSFKKIDIDPVVLHTYESPFYIPLQRSKRKKFALLMSFRGRDYFGMQR